MCGHWVTTEASSRYVVVAQYAHRLGASNSSRCGSPGVSCPGAVPTSRFLIRQTPRALHAGDQDHLT